MIDAEFGDCVGRMNRDTKDVERPFVLHFLPRSYLREGRMHRYIGVR